MTQTDTPANSTLRFVPIAIILIGAILGIYFLRDYLSFEALRDHRATLLEFRDANYVLAVVIFVAAYIAITAFSLPGATVATLTGGFLFGTFPGVFYNVTGATVGASLLFMAAQWGFGDRLAAKMDASEGAIKSIKQGINENQWSMLFLMRLVPAVPFFVANLIPALVGVPLRRFFISTFVGILPGALVYTSAGAGLGAVFDRGETPDLGLIFEPQFLFPIIGLCALAALPVVLKAFRKKDI